MEAQHFGLDDAKVRQYAKLHEGYALSLQNAPQEQNTPRQEPLMLRASSLALAASYWVLLDPVQAKSLFRQAAEVYNHEALRMPFAVVLAICGGDSTFVQQWEVEVQQRVGDALPPDLFFADFLTVLSLSIEPEMFEKVGKVLTRLLDQGQNYEFMPMGRLNIPFIYYRNIGQALKARDADGPLRSALVSYLQHTEAIIRRAMIDSFHWEKLHASILPVEPETLAICVIISNARRRWHKRSLIESVSDRPTSPLGRSMIRIAEALASSP